MISISLLKILLQRSSFKDKLEYQALLWGEKNEAKRGDSLSSLLHPPSPKISSPLTPKEGLILSLFKNQ